MTKVEKLLAGRLLDRAAQRYSCHGCNDLDDELIAGISDADKKAIAAALSAWNSGDKDEEFKFEHIPDWLLMQYFADQLKDESE